MFLDIAARTGGLEDLINASYKDPFYKGRSNLALKDDEPPRSLTEFRIWEVIGDVGTGQSPLHVAIERRSFDHVKMLVQNGADVQAKANGTFFQRNTGLGFYFGE